MRKENLLKIILLTVSLFILAACGNLSTETASENIEQASGEKGVMTLKVNPEIQVEYNEEELVTGVTGKNDEGSEIISHYYDFIGKEAGTVLEELVHEIYEAGYLVDGEEGNPKSITLELETGSVLPSEDYLTKMSESVQNAIGELDLFDDENSRITYEEAKKIVLEEAELTEEDVNFNDTKPSEEVEIYEMEFTAESTEYKFEVAAENGEILNQEVNEQNYSPQQNAQANEVEENEDSRNQVRQEKVEKIQSDGNQPDAEQNEENKRQEITENEQNSNSDQANSEEEPETEKSPSNNSNQETEEQNSSNPDSETKEESSSVVSEKSRSELITLERAKQVALEHVGLSGTNVKYDDVEFEYDDGIPVYEIEFYHGGMEYEVEIHGITETILDFEHDDD